MEEPIQSQVVFHIVPHKCEAYWGATRLRDEILRRPLGMSLAQEELEKETGDTHVIAELQGKIVASLTLTPQGNGVIRTRQVAVAQNMQRTGIGQGLMAFAEKTAQDMGYNTMSLHARLSAVDFYLKLGYEIASERFEEVNIPHYIMRRDL